MAYTINKTDGTVLATVSDGSLDTTTNISLIGKGYSGYGEAQNENFISLLENFANTTTNAPDKALTGQLFYDTTVGALQVYDGTSFVAVSGTVVSTSAPSSGSVGDIWWNSTNKQLYAYDGTSWILVGPPTATDSGPAVDTITDSAGANKNIIRFKLDGTTVAIASTEAFVPGVSQTGFSNVFAGLTLSSTVTGNKFHGTATNADSLGGVSASSYLLSNTNDTTTGTLTIQNDSSLVLGADGDVLMTQDGSHFILRNSSQDGDIRLAVNSGGSNTTGLTVTGAGADVTVANALNVTGNTTLSGTLTVGSGVTTLNNLIISGDLTVEGTSTIVNTETLTVEDNILELNSGVSGSPSTNSGLEIQRGTADNVTFLWNESIDKWTVGTATMVAATFEGALTGNVTGDVTGNVTGNVNGNTVGSNSVGTRTVSTGDPTGGSDGDIWYKYNA